MLLTCGAFTHAPPNPALSTIRFRVPCNFKVFATIPVHSGMRPSPLWPSSPSLISNYELWEASGMRHRLSLLWPSFPALKSNQELWEALGMRPFPSGRPFLL